MKQMNLLMVLAVLFLTACQPNAKQEETNTEEVKFIPGKARIFITAKDTELRLTEVADATFEDYGQPKETQPFILVDPKITFQTMEGIGAALSDASAETFYKLPEKVQKKILTAFYDKDAGIAYNFARTNIASCDFSSGTYSYIEEYDTSLSTFSVAHDEKYRIPFIKEAFDAANGKIKLFVSPWSPPAWMKSNNNALQGGTLLDEYKSSWAMHYVKFIQEYEKQGIPIWGLSVQNEPMAVQRWESCVYTATEERDFIKYHLGPTLHKNGMDDKNLIAWDHNRDQIYQRATTILSDPEAAKYVWGIGFHWYEPWTGGDMQFDNLKLTNQAFPDKKLVFTEGCVEAYDPEKTDEWYLGERYGYAMLNDFNSGTVAWTDWNLFLDETGGPNHVGNFCFAPIHADTRTGELVYTNSYYYIGHFSKFVQAGAKRVAASSSRYDLQSTAFLNPDGSLVVVVLNKSEATFNYKLMIEGKATSLESLPRSIMTLIL